MFLSLLYVRLAVAGFFRSDLVARLVIKPVNLTKLTVTRAAGKKAPTAQLRASKPSNTARS